ncbi:MAG: TonB-dependent receptor, partial [Chitinophagaceae bacterium]
MKKQILLLITFCSMCIPGFSQSKSSITINGKVIDKSSGKPIAYASVKTGNTGAVADTMGNFRIAVAALPATLLISSTEYEPEEVTVNNPDKITVGLESSAKVLNPVVIGSTKIQGKLLNAPVSDEVLGKSDIINSPKSPYESILAKKGLDVTVSSITYRTYSTRGFNGSGSSRVNQMMDGMDNQAPGLNFSVGNFIGLTDLDIESVEILPGASSALYGPGGVNGTIILNSKSPFRYPGLSVLVKNGITDIGKKQRNKAGGYYDYTIRWAKKFNDMFAFKIGAQY